MMTFETIFNAELTLLQIVFTLLSQNRTLQFDWRTATESQKKQILRWRQA